LERELVPMRRPHMTCAGLVAVAQRCAYVLLANTCRKIETIQCGTAHGMHTETMKGIGSVKEAPTRLSREVVAVGKERSSRLRKLRFRRLRYRPVPLIPLSRRRRLVSDRRHLLQPERDASPEQLHKRLEGGVTVFSMGLPPQLHGTGIRSKRLV